MAAENVADNDLELILKLIEEANWENEEFETEIKSAVHESHSDISLFLCDTCHKQYKTESGLTRHINKHNLKINFLTTMNEKQMGPRI